MTLLRETILYDGPGGPFEGVAVRDATVEGVRPGVLLLPNVLGSKEADFLYAEKVAALGYVVLVADLFGEGRRATRADEKPSRYMDELNADRLLLRARLAASLDVLKALPDCDSARIAAIGFCFGGKCVLDMARAGLPFAGGVSFHGVYERPPYDNVVPIRAKLLLCHGWEDPLAPPDAVLALAGELTQGKADWQIHAYGHTGHAFTDTSINMPERGMAYSPDADQRSFRAMTEFLAELFS